MPLRLTVSYIPFQDGSIVALSPVMNFYNGYVAGYFICASQHRPPCPPACLPACSAQALSWPHLPPHQSPPAARPPLEFADDLALHYYMAFIYTEHGVPKDKRVNKFSDKLIWIHHIFGIMSFPLLAVRVFLFAVATSMLTLGAAPERPSVHITHVACPTV
jgi:hypothetical protein